MLKNNKRGASNAFMVLAIFIGIVLIVAAVYMTFIQNKGKVNPYAEEEKQVEPVSTTVDSVPIPTGFYYVGGTKLTGVVISDSQADFEKGDNHEAAKNLVGNQYVWVPVENIDDFKRNISNQFGIKDVNASILDTEEPIQGINLWEMVFADEITEKGTIKVVKSARTDTTLAEAKAMYDSVKKYGGFYVARYEAGLLSPRGITEDIATGTKYYAKLTNKDILFKSGTYPCNYIAWSDSYIMEQEQGGVVELARSIYPASNANLGAVSTLIYGVEWEAMTAFCSTAGKNNSGNYLDAEYSFIGRYLMDEKTNVYTTDSISSDKEKAKAVLFTSGASSYTRANNIYDISGSLDEWTMEGMTMVTDDMISYGRIVRGGSFKDNTLTANNRKYKIQNYMGMDVGFRTALYIK